MTILISPLDWGLGHATRIIPIIKHLSKKHKIIIAAGGKGYYLLKNYFPDLEIIKLPPLNFKYSKHRLFFELKIVASLPKLLFHTIREHFIICSTVKRKNIDLVISDNCFGMFCSKAKTVFITHQINIQVPQSKILEKMVYRLNSFFIKKFDRLWIPDYKGNFSLAGALSQDNIPAKKYYYIGIKSRFENLQCSPDQYKYVAIVSGVEPQRTVFEQKLREIFLQTDEKALIISGNPQQDNSVTQENLTIVPHLDDIQFCSAVRGAQVIIARSGYSTIMDLYVLGKKAILVPTPGQTEQEYLARFLAGKKLFLYIEQKNLDKINPDILKKML